MNVNGNENKIRKVNLIDMFNNGVATMKQLDQFAPSALIIRDKNI